MSILQELKSKQEDLRFKDSYLKLIISVLESIPFVTINQINMVKQYLSKKKSLVHHSTLLHYLTMCERFFFENLVVVSNL